MKKSTQTFEEALKQLEEIVRELETGDLTLENALKRFEQGMTLSRFCSQKLEETEQKVALLIKTASGDLMEAPFLESPAAPSDVTIAQV